MKEKIIAGWKGIEAYMASIGLPARKAQLKKWERKAGFPVRRTMGKTSTVYALPADISAWLAHRDRLKGCAKDAR